MENIEGQTVYENIDQRTEISSKFVEQNLGNTGNATEEDEPIATPKKRIKSEKPVRTFPQYSIAESMVIPRVIGAQNAGKPWLSEHVATALNISKNTNNFFYQTSASRDYGFTTGTSRAKTMELTALGRKLAFPESPDDEELCAQEAFNNIDVFKKVYDYYKGAPLPEDKYLCNTLRESFHVDSSYHEDFLRIFKDNVALIGKSGRAANISSIQLPQLPTSVHTATVVALTSNSSELFVIMPFSEKTSEYPKGYFDEVYNSLFVPAAAEAGFAAKTAKRSGSDIIQSTIISDIYNATIVLVDLTEHNPNVLFELGLAIAFRKRVVLVRAKGTAAIFDVDNLLRVYDYDKNLWKSTIERDVPNLSKHIESTLQTDGSMYLDILLKK